MGTTQRIGSGVRNEPNWGNLTSIVTSVARTIEDLESVNTDSPSIVPSELVKQQQRILKLTKRRDNHVKSTFERLVKLGGGLKSISTGKSSQIGKAGIKSSGKLVSFFIDVNREGLNKSLSNIGFNINPSSTVQNIIDYLISYCGDSSIGMDETAANEAICAVLRDIENLANGDVLSLETLFSDMIDSEKLSEILCTFFGTYIFEYLSERFEERITQIRGETISKETFREIKNYILGKVKRINDSKPINKIDWSGNAGRIEIEKIFEAVIKIEQL